MEERNVIMDDKPTQWQPVEPTTPGPDYIYPYADEIGIPPPPPHIKKSRRSPLIVVVALAIVLLLVVSAGVLYLAYSFTLNQVKSTPPSPSYQQELLATDFPTFITGFRQALITNDVQALSTVEDNAQFQEVCYMADTGCTNTWQTTKAQLEQHKLQLFIPSHFSTITDIPNPSFCQNMKPEAGYAWKFIHGTFSQTANLVVPNNGPAVFAFQQPSAGSPWTWDAAILNMTDYTT